MASILAPLLPTLAPATLILLGFLLLWRPMNHLQDGMNELRSDMKDGFERMERQLDKQQVARGTVTPTYATPLNCGNY